MWKSVAPYRFTAWVLGPVCATWDWEAISRRWTLAGTHTHTQVSLLRLCKLAWCFLWVVKCYQCASPPQASLAPAAMPSCHEEVTGNQGKSYTHFRTYSFPKWVSVLNLATDIRRQIYIITVDLQIFLCTYLATMRKTKSIKQYQVKQEGWLRPQECLPSDVLTVKQTTHNTTDF